MYASTYIRAVNCSKCKLVLMLQSGRQGSVPPVVMPDLHFCPACGGEATQLQTLNDAWQQTMAYYYSVPLELFKQLYAGYMTSIRPNGVAGVSFDRFFHQLMDQAREELASAQATA